MKHRVIRKSKSIFDMSGGQKPVLLRILPVIILCLLLVLFYFVYREEKRMEEERYPAASQGEASLCAALFLSKEELF